MMAARSTYTTLTLLVLAGFATINAFDINTCERIPLGNVGDTLCYGNDCMTSIKNHIKYEFGAAFKYMYMGAHFAQATVNRPGLAKMLLEAASEERGHAIMMLDYLHKRGMPFEETFSFTKVNLTDVAKVEKYRDALLEALNMEIEVTELINTVVDQCSKDFHGADVFTDPFLNEQHEGVRKLQAAVKTYGNMINGFDETHPATMAMIDFAFDLKVLAGTI